MLALYRQAASGKQQVVFVEGEAGIGKSAIVGAFLDAVRGSTDPVLIGYGQCVEQHGEREPFMAVLEALERLSRARPDTGCGPSCAPSLRAGWRRCRRS